MKKTSIAIFGVLMILVFINVVFAEDYGSKEIVEQVQEALNNAGYYCGTPDGVVGSKTVAAISDYRAANGLKAGTEIDEELYMSLVCEGEQMQETEDIQESSDAEEIVDDDCIEKVFLHYADSIAKVSYAQVKSHLDEIGYSYETTISVDDLATFHIQCEKGMLYMCFYPLGNDDTAYGDPNKEMLTIIEYRRDDKWITAADSFHLNATELSSGDKNRKPVSQKI